MRTLLLALCSVVALAADRPTFNDKGELLFPTNYREWVYLSSGLGMTYGPAAAQNLVSPMFDNVFVNPPAYAAFKETGKWPESTIFVLEIRYSVSQGSINKGGFYQSDIFSIEAAVKDSSRFEKSWGYFNFDGGLRPSLTAVKAFDRKASCYGCHEPNGAVENTFSQFYPTALSVAEKMGTVRASYQPPAPSPVRLFHTIQAQGEAASAILDKAKVANSSAMALRESSLNAMGYAFLQQGNKEQAIGVLQWTAAAFPQSANAQDSLSEVYEEAGQPALALASAKRAHELLAGDTTIPADRRDRVRQAIEERIVRLSKK
ncbi:cytochrome P460 family protein [uncultured Paludibaculum sp.]|uniref:cytochrome P460 family protein n=1 Tax=uncultured Paludibaculum sp. TaxID=1765020 RepID=UPI002AABCFAB|nr:cytochrome P460 family protein [uncultured Paludibaculum sp.]